MSNIYILRLHNETKEQIGKVTKRGESASTYVNITFPQAYRNNYKEKYKRELPKLFPGFVTYLKGRDEGGTDRANGAYRLWLGTPPHDILGYEVHRENISKNFNGIWFKISMNIVQVCVQNLKISYFQISKNTSLNF